MGRKLFQRAGLDFDALHARAQRPGFRPVAMNLTGSVALDVTVNDDVVSNNVVGVLPGTQRPNEAVLYMAHWDHLGRCPARDGDDICNGAVDNATGTAALD